VTKWIQLVLLLGMLNGTAPSAPACSCGEAKVKITKKALRNWLDTFDGAIFVGTAETMESIDYRSKQTGASLQQLASKRLSLESSGFGRVYKDLRPPSIQEPVVATAA
jgi:hypothetical protein